MKSFRFEITIFLFIFAFAVLTATAQKLTADERKIVDYIDKHGDDAISLLERSVNIESPTENLAGVKSVGMLFGKELEAIGMTVKWLDMPPAMKRGGHLLAESKGTKGKRLLILGHIDTVLSGEKYRRDGDIVYGTGTGDMKGGDVVIVQALKALQAAGVLNDTQIIVMLTGDEESSGHPVESAAAICLRRPNVVTLH